MRQSSLNLRYGDEIVCGNRSRTSEPYFKSKYFVAWKAGC
jgi:hypothetical protein